MDCSIDWIGTHWAMVSGDEQRLINLIHKLKEQHPDEVTIQYEPANNHGMIVALVPRKWIRIQPPRRMSDEQRAQSAARLRQYREKNDQFAASGGSDDKQ